MAREMLSCSGYHSIELKPVVHSSATGSLFMGMFRTKPAEIILFYRQLALLLESGVDIVTSIQLLQNQVSNKYLVRVLEEAVADLRNGSQLSAALSRHPEVFAPIYCRTMQVGEQTGNLEVVLRQMADYMEKELTAAKGVKGALMYPLITALVAVLATGVMVTFVLPSFTRLYDSFGAELPFATRMLIAANAQFQRYGVFLLIFMATGIISLYLFVRTEPGRYRADKAILEMPLIGRVVHLKELARCGRSISLLFRAGLPMTEIMSQLIAGCNNRVISKALTDVRESMVRGEGLSAPMSRHPIFLPMFVQMISVGEETGTLDTTLMAVAQTYETEVDDRTRTLVGLIQPAMTVLIGAGVGLITLSMVSAMYSIYGQALK
ncbi:MAG: type II secretion system F family protein [Chloroflexi bacterium]|nr:type II secretion system F family protein [Chloroflexota bacterium]